MLNFILHFSCQHDLMTRIYRINEQVFHTKYIAEMAQCVIGCGIPRSHYPKSKIPLQLVVHSLLKILRIAVVHWKSDTRIIRYNSWTTLAMYWIAMLEFNSNMLFSTKWCYSTASSNKPAEVGHYLVCIYVKHKCMVQVIGKWKLNSCTNS